MGQLVTEAFVFACTEYPHAFHCPYRYPLRSLAEYQHVTPEMRTSPEALPILMGQPFALGHMSHLGSVEEKT